MLGIKENATPWRDWIDCENIIYHPISLLFDQLFVRKTSAYKFVASNNRKVVCAGVILPHYSIPSTTPTQSRLPYFTSLTMIRYGMMMNSSLSVDRPSRIVLSCMQVHLLCCVYSVTMFVVCHAISHLDVSRFIHAIYEHAALTVCCRYLFGPILACPMLYVQDK